MKSIQYPILKSAMTAFLALFLGFGGLMAQTVTSGNPTVNEPGGDIYNDRDKVEKRTGSFSPAYFSNPENRHYQVRLEVTGQGLQATGVERAVGKMPYVERAGGEVRIVVRDAQNEALSTYYIEDPALLRSCELREVGSKLPVGATVFLPLPNNRNMATLEISGTAGGGKLSLEIGDLVRRAGD